MKMKIGERVIEATVEERTAAKAAYEKAKSEKKNAALLEQNRPNVFQMSVANVMPGDEVEVTLGYSEYLIPTDAVYEFVYPTVVGPRYTEQRGATAGPTERWTANPYLKEKEVDPITFDIKVAVQSGIPIQDITCASHPVAIKYAAETKASITLDGSETNSGNRDYILRYRLAGEKIDSGLLLHENPDGENFFVLNVQPPENVTPAQITAREYVFVVDVSGSMGGFPLKTAKELLRNLIGSLKPSDQFNVLLFAGASQMLSSTSIPANPANVRRALDTIDNQNGGGSTRLLPALKQVLAMPQEEAFSRNIIVVTDGYVTVEDEAFATIRENLNKANLYAFGIGSSVNRHLIEGMARAGYGEPFIVTKPSEAAATAEKLQRYLGAPVLTATKIEFDGFEAYDVHPKSMPDVLAQRPLVVWGKWKGKAKGNVRLRGISAVGEKFTDSLAVTESSERGTENPALSYLWARQRISELSDRCAFSGGGNSEAIQEITNLGLTHNLLTKYTSFVAIDHQSRDTNTDPSALSISAPIVKQPLPLPSGVGKGAIPEPSTGLLLLSSLFFLLARRKRSCKMNFFKHEWEGK
jgi:Ca-activated chloride channel family protein